MVNVTADLKEFVTLHREHGRLSPKVGLPTPNGTGWVACPCGVTFERWVTPEDAASEMALEHLRPGSCLGTALLLTMLSPACWLTIRVFC